MTMLAATPQASGTAARAAFAALEPLYQEPPVQAGAFRAGLGEALARAYGGDLAIPLRRDRPTVVANFVETLDGVVAMDPRGRTGGGAVSGFSRTDRFVMGLLRAVADVVVVGAGTVRASTGSGWTPASAFPDLAAAYAGLRRELGLAPDPVTLIVTRRGDLPASHAAFRDPARRVVIAAPAASASRLRHLGFPERVEIESLGQDDAVSPVALLGLAERLGARVVLSEGGPHVLGGLAGSGFLDELFLTIAPQLVGRAPDAPRLSLIEGVALWPDRALWGRLSSVRRGGDHLYLRYRFTEASS